MPILPLQTITLPDATNRVFDAWLDEVGIAYCGRYGDWKYIWTDQSFISGENAAQRVLDRPA